MSQGRILTPDNLTQFLKRKEGITDENFTMQKIIVESDFVDDLGGRTLGARTVSGDR